MTNRDILGYCSRGCGVDAKIKKGDIMKRTFVFILICYCGLSLPGIAQGTDGLRATTVTIEPEYDKVFPQEVIDVSLSGSNGDSKKHEVTSKIKISKKVSTITIMVPKDYDLYRKKLTAFVQGGGENPLKSMKFVKKRLDIPYTDDLIRASAQAAAEEILPRGGPARGASIAYLKVLYGTAYVLLDIDLDGWAGSSVSIAIIHPLVEKTLLRFSTIKKVIFSYAPDDS